MAKRQSEKRPAYEARLIEKRVTPAEVVEFVHKWRGELNNLLDRFDLAFEDFVVKTADIPVRPSKPRKPGRGGSKRGGGRGKGAGPSGSEP